MQYIRMEQVMGRSNNAVAMEPEGYARSATEERHNVVPLRRNALDYESFNQCSRRQSDDPNSPRAPARPIAVQRANEFREFAFIFAGLIGFALLFAMALSLTL